MSNGIRVLSLFDGISVAREALKDLGTDVSYYGASEIDKKAIEASTNNHNDIIQLGDVKALDTTELGHIDLLIGGSPCQDLSSIRKNREGLDGEKSGLFFEAVRILEELKQINPSIKFVFENVASMRDVDRDRISNVLGVNPVMICSSKFTAQLRKRYYWTNIDLIRLPSDQGQLLSDVIEHGHVDRAKSLVVLTKSIPETFGGMKRYLEKGIGQVVYLDKINGKKSTKLSIIQKRIGEHVEADGFQYNHGFRRMTITELCRLQGLRDDYMNNIAYTTAHRCLGNAFTMPVIKYILSFANFRSE